MDMEAILARVDRRLKELDISADAASKRAGKPDAIRNLRRAAKGKIGVRGPKMETLAALASALDMSLSELVSGGAEENTQGYDARQVRSHIVAVRGFTQAGQWNEFENWEDESQGEIPIPEMPGIWPGLDQFAYRVRGNSMDAARIFDGEYVICVQYFDAREDLRAGDIVVVERTRNSAVERTVKQVEIDGKVVRFCPRSTDPRFKPIVVEIDGEMKEADDTEVRIVGLVVGRWGKF